MFGGGHVILPLLRAEVVPNGWVADNTFLAGYGAAQALPGPLFTFAGYLGTAIHAGPNAWVGGLWCLLAIFLPAVAADRRSAPVLASTARKDVDTSRLAGRKRGRRRCAAGGALQSRVDGGRQERV